MPGCAFSVLVSSGSGPLKNGSADAGGNFFFSGLAPGDYRVFGWDAEAAEANNPPPSLTPYQSAAKTVRLDQAARGKIQVTAIAPK